MVDPSQYDLDTVHRNLDEVLVRATLTKLFSFMTPLIASTEFRLVGSAATLLRGISLCVADIDFLFKERSDLDAFDNVLSASKQVICLAPPTWINNAQYFSKYLVDSVVVEFSTVEVDAESDYSETIGSGPWQHYENIVCGPYLIPTVAVELRLLTELRRNRPEKYLPILNYFRTSQCDVQLVKRGMATLGLSEGLAQEVTRNIEHSQR